MTKRNQKLQIKDIEKKVNGDYIIVDKQVKEFNLQN